MERKTQISTSCHLQLTVAYKVWRLILPFPFQDIIIQTIAAAAAAMGRQIRPIQPGLVPHQVERVTILCCYHLGPPVASQPGCPSKVKEATQFYGVAGLPVLCLADLRAGMARGFSLCCFP